MANPKKRKAVKKVEQKPPPIPEQYQDYVYLGLLVISIFVFFGSAIFSGGFVVSDNIASISFRPYVAAADSAGEFPQWMPYIFSGMPGYGALLTQGARLWDIVPQIVFGVTGFVGTVFGSDLARVLCYYAIFAIGMYLLMRLQKHEKFVSFFVAFAATFSTGILVWVMIGHNTKPIVFAMFPYIFILMEKLREKFSLIYAVLLVFAVHFMNEGSHLQMIFYGICAFGLYLVMELINRLITKNQPLSILRPALLLALAGGLSFMMSADRYLSTLEYTPYSTRGSGPIVKTEQAQQDATGGNPYDYATMWSFSPEEVITFVVPNYFGFGKMEYEGTAMTKPAMMRTYWGPKTFEDAAPYMGIFVLLFALIGSLIYRRNVFVQFLVLLSIFALLLSFGNKSFLYDFFYYNIPNFNKFRAPSMSLALIHFALPILAGFGLTGIIKWRKELTEGAKKLLNVYMGLSGLVLVIGLIFAALFKSSYIEAVSTSDKSYISQYLERIPDFTSFIWSSMISDWIITGIIAVVAAALVFMFVKSKIKPGVFFAAIALLLLVDLWRVGYRPMEYSEKEIEKEVFSKTDVVAFLEQDKSLYRVADFASPSPNVAAYHFMENVNGYHSAKLRIYQDIMDVANQLGAGSTSEIRNPLLWDLLNVKYLITDQNLSYNAQFLIEQGPDGQQKVKDGYELKFQSNQTGGYIIENKDVLPRAFFVSEVRIDSAMGILIHLRNADFNPGVTAYLEEKLNVSLDQPLQPNSVNVLEKKNEYIKIEATATGNNLLVLSEIFFPPCWHAYIDGKETDIHKTNFAFRSVVVPDGKHIIEFKYKSESFEQGKTLSIIANIFTFAALAVGIFLSVRNRKNKQKEMKEEEQS